jgi:outer membrane protein W
MKMPASSAKFIALFLILLIGNNAFAQDDKWIIRALPSYLLTANDSSPVTETLPPPLGEETTSQSIEDAAGFGLGLEYMWNKSIGIEVAAFLSTHDSDMLITNDLGTFAASDSTSLRTFTFGANYYFQPNGRVQWSLGGFVPIMFVDGTDHVFTEPDRTEHRDYDQDYGLGVKGGMAWSFAADSPWTLNLEARYMFLLVMESETVGDVEVDPLVLSVGVGYRF